MTSIELLPAAVLKRKAVVYIRQSTQAQVQTNLESRRRQYELVDVARQRGFREVEVIDVLNAQKFAEIRKTGIPGPAPHSPEWAPDREPTLKGAIRAEVGELLELLK